MATVDHGTPETRARSREKMREFFATVGYDTLPDLDTAKRLTDEADRESADYDATDEPAEKGRKSVDGMRERLREVAREFGEA